MALYGFIWLYLALYGFIWLYLSLFVFTWLYLVLCLYKDREDLNPEEVDLKLSTMILRTAILLRFRAFKEYGLISRFRASELSLHRVQNPFDHDVVCAAHFSARHSIDIHVVQECGSCIDRSDNREMGCSTLGSEDPKGILAKFKTPSNSTKSTVEAVRVSP